MDFSLTEEQTMLRDSVAKYVQENCTTERHRALCASALGFDANAWQTFAQLGWLAMPFDAAQGGLGGGATELMLLSEALGAGLVREPFLSTVVTCGGFLQYGGSEKHQQRYIPSIIDGSAQWAFAFSETGSSYNLARVQTTARRQDDVYVLNGAKLSVLNAHCADYFVVSARTADVSDQRYGVSVFIVAASAAGLRRDDFVAVDGSRGAHITLQEVLVGADQVLGEVDEGLSLIESVVDMAIVAIGGEAVGSMQALLDATVEHTRTREQFGQPISKFQALQHRMADMYLKLEETRSLLLNAAILSDERSSQISQACAALKVKVCEAGRFIGQQAIQLHGGIGMTDELSVGHHYKRLLVLAKLYGDESWYLQRYARLSAAASD